MSKKQYDYDDETILYNLYRSGWMWIGEIFALSAVVGGAMIGGAYLIDNQGFKNNSKVRWDDVKKCYIALVNEDGIYTTSLLKDNNNGLYEDIINNTIINKNDIIEYYSVVPYFTQTENIKNSYTKEELKEIVKEFKIGSNEYTYSDDYVLMK